MNADQHFVWPDDLEQMLSRVWEFAKGCCIRDHLLDDALAEEMAKDVSSKLWVLRNSTHFPNWKSLRVYIARMVRSAVIERAREMRRNPIVHVKDLACIETVTRTRDSGMTLQDYLELLQDPRQREVIRLRYGEGLKFEEIRDRFGIPLSTAHNLEKRGMDILRRKLTDKLE